ncbi:MAG: hypothetical protein HRU71_08925 [Planctomycetia bacterium]|nr:MAG: hypothetical protein HRU71_08925 [Planctomycetia bacterium]
MRVLALDFETANRLRSSVCSIGVALIEDQKVAFSKKWLVRPRPLQFDATNMRVHRISADQVKDKPEFDEVWQELLHTLGDIPLLMAHNVSFDINVLCCALDQYGITYPRCEFICSLLIARKVWPRMKSYRLSHLSKFLGISLCHHDAEADALASANIAIAACEATGAATVRELTRTLKITHGRLSPVEFTVCRSQLDDPRIPRKKNTSSKPIPRDFVPTTNEIDPRHPLYGKTVVFTGKLFSMPRKEAMQKVLDCGGNCANSVTKKTSILVLGNKDFTRLAGSTKSDKHLKAEQLILKGVPLKIIPEADFLKLITNA